MGQLDKEPLEKQDNPMSDSGEYWRMMYEELEQQMKQMMLMTSDLIDNEFKKNETELINNRRKIKVLEKQVKNLKRLEHSIKVTFIGKIALKYIALKRKIRKVIKG